MSESTVAIIGSGIVGSIIAYLMTRRGIDVTVFEKGPEYPYPHKKQFYEWSRYLFEDPVYDPPEGIQGLTRTGNYPRNPDVERSIRVGGSATRWEAITLRFHPEDFRTRSLYGFDEDWPITYEDIEPYYCKAESLLGVSGTDNDNPFAPSRSTNYPLPPFSLSYGDKILADRLKKRGIVLHTTPQARTRRRYEKRPGCVNYGICGRCPIGARYSPNYHLELALQTGLCRININSSVRRIILDNASKAKTIYFHPDNAANGTEHHAKVIIVACGAIESARLLLLSKNDLYPDGLGNNSGHVGRHLLFHHVWKGDMQYKDYLFPDRFGGRTGECHQFMNPSKRGYHGGIKVTMPDRSGVYLPGIAEKFDTAEEIIRQMKALRHKRTISFASESSTSDNKYVTLSEKRDRFGDPFAHVHYESTEFDNNTYEYAKELLRKFADATGAVDSTMPSLHKYHSGAHHMGTVRMGRTMKDSVVDSFGRVHGISNLFAVGGGNFVSSSSVNPTLTITALAIRSAEYIMDQLL